MSRKYFQAIVIVFILVTSAVLYGWLWKAPPLTWDDDSNIFSNPHFLSGEWWTFWRGPYYGLYVPVTSSIWALLYFIGHGSAVPFRLLNTSLHLINIWLVYKLLAGAAERLKVQSPWSVLAGVAFFAWHPLQVETIAWISGGRDLLAATFALWATLFYFKAPRRWTTLSTALVLFLAALLSKPGVVVLPLVWWLSEWAFGSNTREQKRVLPWLAGALLFALPIIALTQAAQADYTLSDLPLWKRPLIMLDSFAFYLRKTIWPWPLSADYERTPQYVLDHPKPFLLAIAIFIGVLALQLRSWQRERKLSFIWVWMLLLLPVSGLMPFSFQKISTTADHYNYLPLVVVSILIMKHLSQKTYGAAAIALPVFFSIACLRVPVWGSEEAFFTDMSEQQPESYSSAIGMSIVECEGRKDYERGVYWTEVALKARPNDIKALANQAYCLLHSQNYLRVIELDFYLDHLNLRELEEKQPFAYSSFLASIGTAQIEMKAYEDGFQYLCEAYRVLPSEPNNVRNLELASQILKQQGLDSTCPSGDDSESMEDLDPLFSPDTEE